MSPAIPTDIICGVDFSDESARALTWAQLLVTRLGARLVVVTVVDPLLAGAARTQTDSGWFLNDGRRDLETFVTRAVGQSAATAAELVVVVGAPVLALLQAAEQRGALIVVGTRGLGRAERMIFGSTTLRLMRTTTWPVLAVPHAPADHGHGPAAAPLAIDRLICGVDFSASSKAAARTAHTLGQALSVPVEIVHAVQMTARPAVWDAILSPPEQEQIAAASSALDAVVSSLGSPLALKAARLGRPEDVLTAAAAAQPSLIVLGLGDANGHRPGTTAMRVIAGSRVPVLTVPPDAS